MNSAFFILTTCCVVHRTAAQSFGSCASVAACGQLDTSEIERFECVGNLVFRQHFPEEPPDRVVVHSVVRTGWGNCIRGIVDKYIFILGKILLSNEVPQVSGPPHH